MRLQMDQLGDVVASLGEAIELLVELDRRREAQSGRVQ
jgi:hypothetical protein